MAPSLPLNLFIFPTKLSPTGIVTEENNPLEWIYLHHKGHEILTAYLTLLVQLVNQAGANANNYVNSILSALLSP